MNFVVTSYWRFLRTVERMGNSGSPDGYRGRQRERELQRRQQSQRAKAKEDRPVPSAEVDARRRTAATACRWCGGSITPRSRGPIPKWCSATCRHRAWEQGRAAASGRSAVEVVERRVEIRVPVPPTGRDWARLLGELLLQLDDGRVYDRDLGALSVALGSLLEAFRRRQHATGAQRELHPPVVPQRFR